MDSDQGKLFIGGISWETSEEKLKEYFGKYGEVLQTVIMRDKITGRPRGFGFVVFQDPSILDAVLQDPHTIDGRTVEAKRALSRDEQHTSRSGNPNAGRSFGGGGNIKTKKIFVGGLPPTLTDEGFRQYFQAYGQVTDVVIMFDQNTQRPRGFGFISFDSEDAVDRVLHKSFHELEGKLVEVKRALPRDANNSGRSTGSGSSNTYDGRMESNRYTQNPATGGGFPAYGTSGYGYGATNNGVGYGSYGVGGYGAANAGYSNAPNAGYITGPPGDQRSQWNNQTHSGYGYGGTMSAAMGQSPSGATGYGNQGYGYGGYGANDGSYANPSGFSAVGGRDTGGGGGGEQQGAVSGYMSGGYGDSNGNSGYQNTGYGGGYGGGQSRQLQQQ
eukprot:TRINITY_DN3710_c0_g1_i2.p1 TRINITY_DN3710_c0_g1~~TRINITY_DN3710_c0_g1_i2.p1  ORF type:complete len:386 (-),score=94.42 TRINITY_DN3710_c0_g1_i2:547-1704(-)